MEIQLCRGNRKLNFFLEENINLQLLMKNGGFPPAVTAAPNLVVHTNLNCDLPKSNFFAKKAIIQSFRRRRNS
jgi:hypothetical protein